jgi:hypothetical protein
MFFKKKCSVQFLAHEQIVGVEDPKPAKKVTPDWYRKMSKEIPNCPAPIDQRQTVKQCLPFRDAMHQGYIIPLWADLEAFSDEDGAQQLSFPSLSGNGIGKHYVEQIDGTPFRKMAGENPHVWKLINPWVIRTTKGWSSLIVPPINHGSRKIVIISGLVDTDRYKSQIHFPFLIDPNFRGIIPKGTPIAQVIPVQRDSHSMSVGALSEEQIREQESFLTCMHANMTGGYEKTTRDKVR